MHSSNLLFVAGLLGTAAAQSYYDTRSIDITDEILERDIIGEDMMELDARGLKTGIAKAMNKIKGGPPEAKKISSKPARVPNKLHKAPPAAKAPKASKPRNRLQKKPPTNIGKNFRRDFDDDLVAEFARDFELDERDLDDITAELEARGLKTGIAKAMNKIKGGPPEAKKISSKPARVPNKLHKAPPAAKAPKASKPRNRLQKKPPTNIGKNFRRDVDDDAMMQFVRDLEEAGLETRGSKKSKGSKGRGKGGKRMKAGGRRLMKAKKMLKKHKKVQAEDSE